MLRAAKCFATWPSSLAVDKNQPLAVSALVMVSWKISYKVKIIFGDLKAADKLGVYEGGMLWPKTGATHKYAQLGLPDKGCAIKELVFWWVLIKTIPRVFERKRSYFAALSYPRLLKNIYDFPIKSLLSVIRLDTSSGNFNHK